MIYSTLQARKGYQSVAGKCAGCDKPVYEKLFMLDDCYNVWAGKCPHCSAVNLLALVGLRGYSSQWMNLTLPTDEEKKMNDMPADCPTRGPAGTGSKVIHGSNAGELYHQLGSPDAAAAQDKATTPVKADEAHTK